jgi:phosphoribosylaminoimidazolecarboxamide formyltransferase/IMP cyclohydrolase
MSPRITNAIISVSDKSGLVDFARGLAAAGVTIYSTGGTRRFLEESGVAACDVSGYTGFPEMMDGRLKTLHPKIFGGILCRHDRADDLRAIEQHGIEPFELVVVNLYPFAATIVRPGVTLAEAIEQIDIGGPSLVRAAAKNHAFTTIATSPRQYAEILAAVQNGGGTSGELRYRLAAEAFAHTAEYDRTIADYFARQALAEPVAPGESPVAPDDSPFPAALNLSLVRRQALRYGENPHQQAALYAQADTQGANLVTGRQLAGKELSYNNLLDLDSALALVRSLPACAAVVIKHNNPCGAASASALADAMRRALDGDPVSAFGGVIGLNQTVDAATAEVLVEPERFVEAIVAPDFAPAAVEILTTRPKWKANVRLIAVGDLSRPCGESQSRQIEGGLLWQTSDTAADPESEWKVVTEKRPTDEQLADLRFTWAVVRHVKSNAIVVGKGRAVCGVGAGQMSRVDSVEIAIKKAAARIAGCVLASDAFFPFADSIHEAAKAGVTAIIQPGGSRRDEEVVAACNEHGLAMIFTGRRHFRH